MFNRLRQFTRQYLIADTPLLAPALLPSVLLAGAAALGATIWFMTRFKCVHPPGGALVIMVVTEVGRSLPQAGHTLLLVLANALSILAAVVLVNKLLLGRHYPQCRSQASPSLHATADSAPTERTDLSHADLNHAVQALGMRWRHVISAASSGLTSLTNLT